jgi:hypothetical protein
LPIVPQYPRHSGRFVGQTEYAVEDMTTDPKPTDAAAAADTPQTRSRRWLWIALGVLAAVVVVGGLVGIVVWSLTRPSPLQVSAREALLPYRNAWASAMQKASVDATFPVEPIDITSLTAAGTHEFQATFTAEEVTALVTVYRYAPSGQAVTLSEVAVRFPAAGQAALSGSAVINGSGYSAEIAGPVGYEDGTIVAQGPISVSVEGFGVGGERRRQATDAALAYLNEFLDAAPGLTVDTAEITADGVVVTGRAPDALFNPVPGGSTQ